MPTKKQLKEEREFTDSDLTRHKMLTDMENDDLKEDAQRKMAWFAIGGMLLYPLAVVIADLIGLENASKILGDMANLPILYRLRRLWQAFYGKEAYTKGK